MTFESHGAHKSHGMTLESHGMTFEVMVHTKVMA